MRITSHASEQYQKNSALTERSRENKRTEPQARVKTTTFGFRLGKLGIDYSSTSTELDPSLSRDVREKREKAQAFRAEAEVGNLRATVGADGAAYRDREINSPTGKKLTLHHINSAMTAYAKGAADILPPPGNMLTSVV